MDWERLAQRRGSRRWFVGGMAGAVAGAAGLASVGCDRGSNRGPTPSGSDEPEDTPTAASTATQQPGQQGESLRYTGYVIGDGAFDPHKTQAGPFYGEQALVFSRLLAYESQTAGSIAADLAETNPEQPDGQTLIFRVRKNARWDDRDPLLGRAVTADDVKFSFERQMGGDASFVRRSQWTNVDKVEVQDASTVVFRMKSPMAAMIEGFADVNAFVVAPELSAKGRSYGPDSQIGSGPFRWVEWQEGKFASVARNPHWHGGSNRPYLDGVAVFQPKDTSEVEAGLRTKRLDVAFVGRPQAERLKKAVPSLKDSTVGQLLFFGMRFFIPQPPFSDVRFRTAVSIALDRRDMVARFFAGSGDVNPWISWPLARWTLPQAELTALAGYRAGSGGRAEDIKEAKALLAASAADKKLPEEFSLLVVDDAEKNLGMGTLMREQLKQALDLNVTVTPVQTGELVKRLFAGSAPWAAGPDSSHTDLDDCVFPYFHSEGTQNTFPLRDKEMDALIVSQRTELDAGKRRQIGFDIQRKLLALNVGVNFVSERVVALSWPYVRDFPLDASDGYQHRFASCWIDRNDPTFHGR